MHLSFLQLAVSLCYRNVILNLNTVVFIVIVSYIKGCDSNFVRIYMQVLKVPTNEITTLYALNNMY